MYEYIKFYFRLDKTVPETDKMFKLAFREETSSRTQTFYWFLKFKSGVTSTNDAEHSGCPSMNKMAENVAEVQGKCT
jgi:hypothetical protein